MKTKGAKLNEEMLLTLFSEMKCIINSRRLTATSISPDDHDAITPNSLLHSSLDPSHSLDSPMDGVNLRKKDLQHIIDEVKWFWVK